MEGGDGKRPAEKRPKTLRNEYVKIGAMADA
jgi:hypothetical protein